jgi:hypothetical protein
MSIMTSPRGGMDAPIGDLISPGGERGSQIPASSRSARRTTE